MAAATILDFQNSQILLAGGFYGVKMHMGSKGPSCITLPNFMKVCQSVVELLRFFAFSRWRPPPSWILEILKFY